jgi:hypothetical protein
MRVASVHSQAEHEAIGQLIGPTAQNAFLGAERLDNMSWRWRDGTPWDFEGWGPGQPSNNDDQSFVVIRWQPGVGVVWHDEGDMWGVICEAVSISAIRGDVPTILRLGGPENAAMIAASEER